MTTCVNFLSTQRLFPDIWILILSEPTDFVDKLSTQILLWTSKDCLQLSLSKTNRTNFQKKRNPIFTTQPLVLQTFPNSNTRLCKISWYPFRPKTHLDPSLWNSLAKYTCAVNILKFISHPSTGCSKTFLIQFYKSLIAYLAKRIVLVSKMKIVIMINCWSIQSFQRYLFHFHIQINLNKFIHATWERKYDFIWLIL